MPFVKVIFAPVCWFTQKSGQNEPSALTTVFVDVLYVALTSPGRLGICFGKTPASLSVPGILVTTLGKSAVWISLLFCVF